MFELWIPISDITGESRDFTFDDQGIWREEWREFKLGLRPGKDMVAKYTVSPQAENGALIRGTLTGSVKMACDRCTALFEYDIDSVFDTYEQLPDEDFDEEPRIRKENGQLQLNMGAILWEEFAVALPFKPLCSEGCKGVCPGCGKDLNSEKCECKQDEGDERLAVFRNLKIK